MSYTSVFGGTTIYPSDVSYLPLALAVDTTLEWPLEASGDVTVAARIIGVTPASAGRSVIMPDATRTGPGQSVLFNNMSGTYSFLVKDDGGTTLATVAPGTQWQIYLTDNTTAAGTWEVYQMGASTATVQASALAGPGLMVVGSQLAQAAPFTNFTGNLSPSISNRAAMYVYTGSGAATLSLPVASTVGNEYFLRVRNQGGGVLLIDPAGTDLINGGASLNLAPEDSAMIVCDGASTWYTVGLGQNAEFTFDFTSIPVTGGVYPLSGPQLNRIAYRFTGNLTSNVVIVVPETVQQYWVTNLTTGSFTLSVATAAQVTPLEVVQTASAILYCDGTEVVAADTSTMPVPLGVAQGGTGAVTASAARANLGISPYADPLVTAANSSAAQAVLFPDAITDGQMLIGNAAAPGFAQTTLTAGNGIGVLNGPGSVTVVNTGSPAPGIVYTQRFSGTGAQTAFTLAYQPFNEDNTQVYISGVYQQKNTYSLSGSTITFASPPPLGTNNIEVVVIQVVPLGTTNANVVNYTSASPGAVAGTVQSKLEQTASVQDYGAAGDGAANDTAAFQAAIDAAYAAGGGTVYVPDGVYKIHDTLVMKSNVTVSCADGAVVDFVNTPSGTTGITFTGTAGAEFAFSVAKTTGDTTLSLSGSPTFAPGDLVHLVAVRNSLSRVDAGTWWLGDGTTSLPYAYFSEFNFIQSSSGGGVYSLAKAILFPGYNVTAANETETLRTTSAAQKITPCENAHWVGGTLKRNASGGNLIIGTWAYNCTVRDCTILRGSVQGTSVVWTASFQCEGRSIVHRNDPTLAWNYATMHAKYNRFKTIGSQDCGFVDLNESYGAQSVDFTYGGSLLFCNTRSYCRDSEFSHCFEELTSHPGCYQEQFKDNRILDCYTDGITVRGYEPEVTGNLVTSTYQWTTEVPASATFTGVISGFNLTASSVTGTIVLGARVSGVGVEEGTTISAQTSGTPGGAGVYVVNISQTVASTPMEADPSDRTYGIVLAYGGPRRGTVRDNTMRGFAYAFAVLGSATREWYWTNCLLGICGNEVSECYAGLWTNFSSASNPVTFTGTISGTTLTVAASPAPTGTIRRGRAVVGAGVTDGTTIVSQTSGTTGGAGVYVLSASSTVAAPTVMNTVDNSLRFIRYDGNVHSFMGRYVVELGAYSAGVSITNNVMHGGFRYSTGGSFVAFVYAGNNCPALTITDNTWLRAKGSNDGLTKYFVTIASVTDLVTYPEVGWTAQTNVNNNYATFVSDTNFVPTSIGGGFVQSVNNPVGTYTSATASGTMTVIPSPSRIYTAIVNSGTGGGNLDRIDAATNCVLRTGDVLYLRNFAAGNPTLIRDVSTSGTGNIHTPGNTSFTITSVLSVVTLVYTGVSWSIVTNTLS